MIRTKSSDAGGWMEVGGQELIESAERRIRQGFAPPPKITALNTGNASIG